MSTPATHSRQVSYAGTANPAYACPACHVRTENRGLRCPSCHFTGGDSMAMFPTTAPPLLPVLDAAGLWSRGDRAAIQRGISRLSRRFPQFRWRVCAVHLPPDQRIRLFGFWLINASPLDPDETAEDRAWTVLLVINTANHRAAAIPGYAAELWFPDDRLQKAMESMKSDWRDGRHGKAVRAFLKTIGTHLETTWRLVNRAENS